MQALPEKGKGEKKMLVENPVKITETQIKKMAKHWTAGHYGQVFDDYHLCVDQDGKHDINDTRVSAGIR